MQNHGTTFFVTFISNQRQNYVKEKCGILRCEVMNFLKKTSSREIHTFNDKCLLYSTKWRASFQRGDFKTTQYWKSLSGVKSRNRWSWSDFSRWANCWAKTIAETLEAYRDRFKFIIYEHFWACRNCQPSGCRKRSTADERRSRIDDPELIFQQFELSMEQLVAADDTWLQWCHPETR